MSKKIDSEIKIEEKVVNQERRFGGSLDYFPVYITNGNEEPVPALFTGNQIKIAVQRAKKNMEDMPDKDGGFLFGIFG